MDATATAYTMALTRLTDCATTVYINRPSTTFTTTPQTIPE